MRLRVAALCLPLLAGPSLAFGAVPVLVRDIAQGLDGAQFSPEQLVSVGDRAVFFLQPGAGPLQPSREAELWTTDGTASGTERLRSFSGQLQSLGGNGRIAFFTRFDFESNAEIQQIWRTDGTAAGTFLLSLTVSPAGGGLFSTIYQGALVFDGCTTQSGCELWTSDGSVAGTRQMLDLTPGPSSSSPHDFTSAGARLYFLADDPTGPALWATDGTTPGTGRVATLPPYSFAHDLTAADDRIFFLEGPGGHFLTNLWTSDGTSAGTHSVPPFHQAGAKSPGVASLLGPLGDSLLFVGFDRADGYQVWATDGTHSGTLRLTSFPRLSLGNFPAPAGAALGSRFVFQGPDQHLWTTRGTRASTRPLTGCPGGCPEADLDAVPVVLGDKLFFSSETPSGDEEEPWVTDGTADGTLPLARLCPPPCSVRPQFIAAALGRVFFTEGQSLWATDGTPGGTVLLGNEGIAGGLASLGSRAVFPAAGDSGPSLGVTDGTPSGTQTLDLHLAHGASSDPALLLPVGNEIRFQTCDSFPAQVWTSDGTAGGTFTVSPDHVAAACAPMARLGSEIYFLGEDLDLPALNLQVWRSDGAAGGAVAITPPDRAVEDLGTAGDRLAIFVQSETVGTELWLSDGTETGTSKVTDLPDTEPGFLAASPGGQPGQFFFQAMNDDGFLAFWYSDGTAGGTRRLVEFFSPEDETAFTGFTRFNGAVYFAAGEGGLWKTDGTAAGTQAILQDSVTELVSFAGSLFLFDESARTLLRSDGSLAGTNLLADMSEDQLFNEIEPHLTVAGGVLYFVAFDPDHGTELWRTDGTRAGNRLVADISPGPGSSSPAELTAAGGLLYFTANDGEHGRELWVTDGTAAGTRQVADIAAGPGSSSPTELTVAGDHLFFNGDDGFTGRELWLLPLGPNL